jgi:hypothetical protein
VDIHVPPSVISEEIESKDSQKIIQTVKMRFRICNYQFRLGAGWILLGSTGIVLGLLLRDESFQTTSLLFEMIGFAVFTVAFALTLALYRCPVCDAYLSRFRPKKECCGKCGVRIR